MTVAKFNLKLRTQCQRPVSLSMVPAAFKFT